MRRNCPRRLAANGNRLQFEMAAAQERACSDEFPCRIVFRGEVAFVDGVELVEEGQVGAGDLHVDEVVHGHAGLGQRAFQAIEHELDLILDFRRRLAGFRIEADSAGQVERIAGENSVAERGVNRFCGRIEHFSRGLRCGLRKCAVHAEDSCNDKSDDQKTESAIHAKPPFNLRKN